MQLPSGQLLLNLIKTGKKGVPRANAFLRTILSRAVHEDPVALADSAVPLRLLRKPVYSGVPSGPRLLSQLNPAASSSELKVAYTTPNIKLAEQFDKGGGVLSGAVEAGRFAYLNKPPSYRTLKNLFALYGHDIESPQGREVLNSVMNRADRNGFLAAKGRHSYASPGTNKPGHRPTLGSLLGELEQLRNNRGGAQHFKKYGSPRNSVEAMKELGFHGSRDIDWFYVKNRAMDSQSTKFPLPSVSPPTLSVNAPGKKWRDIEEVHLFDPSVQAVHSTDASAVDPSSPFTKLMKSLGVTRPPPAKSRWNPGQSVDRSYVGKPQFDIDTSPDSLFKPKPNPVAAKILDTKGLTISETSEKLHKAYLEKQLSYDDYQKAMNELEDSVENWDDFVHIGPKAKSLHDFVYDVPLYIWNNKTSSAVHAPSDIKEYLLSKISDGSIALPPNTDFIHGQELFNKALHSAGKMAPDTKLLVDIPF